MALAPLKGEKHSPLRVSTSGFEAAAVLHGIHRFNLGLVMDKLFTPCTWYDRYLVFHAVCNQSGEQP